VGIQPLACSVASCHSLGWGYEAAYTSRTVFAFDKTAQPSFLSDLTTAALELLPLQSQAELRCATPTLLYRNWKQIKMKS